MKNLHAAYSPQEIQHLLLWLDMQPEEQSIGYMVEALEYSMHTDYCRPEASGGGRVGAEAILPENAFYTDFIQYLMRIKNQ